VGALALASCLPQALADKFLLRKDIIALPNQGAQPGPAPVMNTDFSDTISLPTDPAKKKKIEAAIDYIREKDWDTATSTLQKLLDWPEDVFVELSRKGPDGKETKSWTSVKSEANRLIAKLPAQGMDYYKVNYGPTASKMLLDSKEASNINMLRDVMNRFLHTEAGAEATNLLGTYYLDRGTYVSASLCFEKLFSRDGLAKLSAVTLFKAAYAFHQAGDKANEDRAWKELYTRGCQIQMGPERRTLEELQQYVAASSAAAASAASMTGPCMAAPLPAMRAARATRPSWNRAGRKRRPSRP